MHRVAIKFKNPDQKQFSVTLNKRVDEFFKEKKISKHANFEMILKGVIYILAWAASYFLIILGDLPYGVALAVWAALGFFVAMTAVNIGHDAIHGAYSGKQWVNDLLSVSFNINGASAYMWKKMHNIAHHTYTNIDHHDEDLESLPIIRLSKKIPWKPIHQYQHLYVYFFYGLATVAWVFLKDYKKFFQNEVGNYHGKDHEPSAYFWLFFWKALNLTIFLVIPLIVLPYVWWQILIGYFIMHYASGLTLATIFMMAHAVDLCDFPEPDSEGTIRKSWAVHQLETTANFSSLSKLAQWLTGGLNQQVEHHLFPKICSVHYPKLRKIVKETAEEFGHPYLETSFPKMMASHFRLVRKMGAQPAA